jgi:hypothetical protein
MIGIVIGVAFVICVTALAQGMAFTIGEQLRGTRRKRDDVVFVHSVAGITESRAKDSE